MLGYYLYSIAKLGDRILNQRIPMYEKRHIEFMLRERRNNFLATKTKNT